MEKGYKILYEGGTGELVEKKSRFIAATMPVESEEEALAFIEGVKKKYWDARHNCFAYVIGRNCEIQRCSDDGEPSQTAGKPMLDVIMGEEIHNMAAVVTRYFGGTLLGTGGLVRAYAGAVKEGLAASVIAEKRPGASWLIETDYNGLGKLQYLCGQMEIPILDTMYTENVKMDMLVPQDKTEELRKKITEATNGKAGIEEKGTLWYALINGRVQIL